MQPLIHLHIVLVLLIAFLAAAAVYLYLAVGRDDSTPLKVAGTVLLVIVIVNSLAYFGYYGWHYTRLGEHQRMHPGTSQPGQGDARPIGKPEDQSRPRLA